MSRLALVYNALLGLECTVTSVALVLFGLAYPDRFRSKLWENGGMEEWNSDPNKRIYFYANHKEPPAIPLIWSQRLTDSNLAIAILSSILLVARAVMIHVSHLPRWVSVMYDMLLASLWMTSLVGQNSGDFSDPEHTSEHPWYLTRGCTISWTENRGYCHVAQASFAVSILAAVLYGGRLLLQLMELAYNRGKRHGKEGDYQYLKEDIYYDDVELDADEALRVPEPHLEQALSPVLAFFPSDVRNFRR